MRGSCNNMGMMGVVLAGMMLLDPAFGQSRTPGNPAAKPAKTPRAGTPAGVGIAAGNQGSETAEKSPRAGAATRSKKSAAKEPSRTPEKADLKAAYTVDFRNARFDYDKLVPFGFDTLYGLGLLKPEPRGLRIVIPHHQGDQKPSVGFFPLFQRIIGDFEIIATYELLAADRPKIPRHIDPRAAGLGAGADLYILAEKTLNAASLRRCINPEGEHGYFIHDAIRDESGKRISRYRYVASETRSGKLRFVRAGSKLQYFVAKEEGGPFGKVHEVEFGRDPIGLVRVRATTDGSPTTVETLWQDFTIRAQELKAADVPLYRKRPAANPAQ